MFQNNFKDSDFVLRFVLQCCNSAADTQKVKKLVDIEHVQKKSNGKECIFMVSFCMLNINYKTTWLILINYICTKIIVKCFYNFINYEAHYL